MSNQTKQAEHERKMAKALADIPIAIRHRYQRGYVEVKFPVRERLAHD